MIMDNLRWRGPGRECYCLCICLCICFLLLFVFVEQTIEIMGRSWTIRVREGKVVCVTVCVFVCVIVCVCGADN